MTLREALADWQDFDVAAHALGVCLGLFPEGSCMSDFKAVFWTQNPTGDSLMDCLEFLYRQSILESNDDQQFRWKAPRGG